MSGHPTGGPLRPRPGHGTVPCLRPPSRTRPPSPELGGLYRPASRTTPLRRPLAVTRASAGFPSPASDHIEGELDISEYLIPRPAATFLFRVTGESMIKAGIFPGDVLTVDRAREPQHNDIVVAVVDGEFTVKRLFWRPGEIALQPENDDYEPIQIREGTELLIWGVVGGVVRKL